MSANPLFPASVVGSLPRPAYVRDLINDGAPVSPDEFRRLMEPAVASAVAMQEMAGLDVVTDGEWWRRSYIGVIAELGLDSLQMLELVGAMERELEVAVPDDELVGIQTVRQLLDLVEKRKKAAGASANP